MSPSAGPTGILSGAAGICPKKLIWQGVSSGTINENTKNREDRINKGARAVMDKYPIEAPK